jgi:hypothetical protein
MSDPFPVFSPSGQMLGNMTSDWGQVPNSLPTLPELPAISSSFAPSQTTPGNVVTSQGSTGGGSAGILPAAPINLLPSNAQSGAQPQPTGGITSGSLADYFYRAVIVILGFIFVAIGLNMFRPGIVPNPVNVIKK